MTQHTSSPEHSGRLYYGDGWENSMATLPSGVNARQLPQLQRTYVVRDNAAAVLEQIDQLLDQDSEDLPTTAPKPPEDARPNQTPEEDTNEPQQIPLLGHFVLAATVLLLPATPESNGIPIKKSH